VLRAGDGPLAPLLLRWAAAARERDALAAAVADPLQAVLLAAADAECEAAADAWEQAWHATLSYRMTR